MRTGVGGWAWVTVGATGAAPFLSHGAIGGRCCGEFTAGHPARRDPPCTYTASLLWKKKKQKLVSSMGGKQFVEKVGARVNNWV